MNFLITLVSLFFILNTNASESKYGSAITLKNPISLDKALTSDSKGNEVLVTAIVKKVCKSKGCWMSLAGVSDKHRVTFKDYSFFVPFNLIGKNVLVQGIIEKTEMTLKETKHYAEDAGEDPTKVTKAKTEYRIIATGVEVI